MLATAAVLFLGAMGASVIVAAMGSDPTLALVIFGSSIGLLVCLIVLLKNTASTPVSNSFLWVFSRQARPEMPYTPSFKTVEQRYGSNKPPTLEELHELKDDTRTWVPSNEKSRRSS